MVDNSDITSSVVVDASPLIYLAKLDALDVFTASSTRALVPQAVIEETTRPSVIYRHPDAALIEMALVRGELAQTEPTGAEIDVALRIEDSVSGLHAGECQVLAIAQVRQIPAVLFERRARSVAHAFGIEIVDVIELLFTGTHDDQLLAHRLRRLAELTDMRIGDLEMLRERIARRRLT